ncbi:MAG TPA: hypothetical protein VGX23_27875 [Actinocrinis sp.]|nr:hypothetical protein [Actinocrinis sp.]
MSEVDVLVGQVVPVIGAAVGAYGAGVLTRVEQGAADATVGLGQKVLARLLHHTARPASLEEAVVDLAAHGQDPDALAALRLQVRKILADSPEVVKELAGMLPPGPSATASGVRSVAVAGPNTAPITTGDRSPVVGRP